MFFRQQRMCHGFKTVSEVGRLGVNSKIPRNNTLNERPPFILTGTVWADSIRCRQRAWILLVTISWFYSFLFRWQSISCPGTGNAFEELWLVLANHLWGDRGIFLAHWSKSPLIIPLTIHSKQWNIFGRLLQDVLGHFVVMIALWIKKALIIIIGF